LTVLFIFDSFVVIPLYASSDCFINISASSSFGFPASHFFKTYCASSIPPRIFSIFVLCVLSNHKSRFTIAFGIFLVSVSPHIGIDFIQRDMFLPLACSPAPILSLILPCVNLAAFNHEVVDCATLPIAGATTFSSNGPATALIAAISAALEAISPNVASLHSFITGVRPPKAPP
jgi:hypothetical protein